MHHASSLFADGPETLVSLKVEWHKTNALADSGSQVNMVMPGYVHQHVDHPFNLIGLGSTRTQPLSFMILQVQVTKIARYDEDIIFLVVSDESEFSWCIPLVIETCMLGRIVNVIKESELDRLSISWVMVRTSCLLSK